MRTVPAPHGAHLPWVGTRQGSASCTVGLCSFVFFDILPPLSPVPTYLSQKAYPTACLRAPPPQSLTATTGQCYPPPCVGITCSKHCLFTPMNPGQPLMLLTLPCSPRSIPHPFTTALGLCCALPAHAVALVCSLWQEWSDSNRMSCSPTSTLPPRLLPLGPLPHRGVTPAPASRTCSWNRRLGRDSGGDAACVGLGAPVLGHLSGCCGHRATHASRQVALVWLGMEKELQGIPGGVRQSQPPKVSASTWGLGRQEKGTGPCGDTVSCPCARRSGWQMLPMLAAVTHRCRLALLPGASASMALLALLALLPGASA